MALNGIVYSLAMQLATGSLDGSIVLKDSLSMTALRLIETLKTGDAIGSYLSFCENPPGLFPFKLFRNALNNEAIMHLIRKL